MRGKLGTIAAMIGGVRNIPAYAGKTDAEACSYYRLEEHPRVCGENVSNLITTGLGIGTSPRMRGKLARAREDAAASRNIPAYAGKTCYWWGEGRF